MSVPLCGCGGASGAMVEWVFCCGRVFWPGGELWICACVVWWYYARCWCRNVLAVW